MTRCEEDEPAPFDWAALAPKLLHPLRVAIIESLIRIDIPLSPMDITRSMDEQFDLTSAAYHVSYLKKTGVVRQVKKRRIRGTVEVSYTLVR